MPSATRINYYVLIAGGLLFVGYGVLVLLLFSNVVVGVSVPRVFPEGFLLFRGILSLLLGLLILGMGVVLLLVAHRSNGHVSLR
jgi:hypothetical protein